MIVMMKMRGWSWTASSMATSTATSTAMSNRATPATCRRSAGRSGAAAVARGRKLLADGRDPFHVDTRATFHETVAQVAGNTALAGVLTLLSKRAAWFLSPLEITREAQWDEHAAIADAITAGDAEKATTLMAEHVNISRRSYKMLRGAKAG